MLAPHDKLPFTIYYCIVYIDEYKRQRKKRRDKNKIKKREENYNFEIRAKRISLSSGLSFHVLSDTFTSDNVTRNGRIRKARFTPAGDAGSNRKSDVDVGMAVNDRERTWGEEGKRGGREGGRNGKPKQYLAAM